MKLDKWLLSNGFWDYYLSQISLQLQCEDNINFPFDYIFQPLLWYLDIKSKLGWFIINNRKD